MGDWIDLHIHSDRSSDGDFAPNRLVRMAKVSGLQLISISDHDTVAAYPEALLAGKENGIEVLPSIELTTLLDNREFHLLMPFVEWRSQIIKDLITDVVDRRLLEARERVSKLKALGFDLEWDEVMADCAPFPPLGVTIARTLLNKMQHSQDSSTLDIDWNKYFPNGGGAAPYLFYRDFFMEGKPAFVTRKNIRLLDVLDGVKKTGAVPVLAHPGAPFQNVTEQDISLLKAHGLEGLEVYTSYHDSRLTHYYKRLAEKYDLVPTCGSDFHGSFKPHIAFGSLKDGKYWMVEELQKRRP